MRNSRQWRRAVALMAAAAVGGYAEIHDAAAWQGLAEPAASEPAATQTGNAREPASATPLPSTSTGPGTLALMEQAQAAVQAGKLAGWVDGRAPAWFSGAAFAAPPAAGDTGGSPDRGQSAPLEGPSPATAQTSTPPGTAADPALAEARALRKRAKDLEEQEQYAEAERLYKNALAIKEKILGSEHPDVATSLNNLALFYKRQSRYAEAEPLHKRDLEISEKVLGPDHVDVAITLDNLATLYAEQGQYEAAEPLYRRALAIREKVSGGEHPDLLTVLDSLAGLYRAQERYADAEVAYKRSLAIREKTLEDQHPDLAANSVALAELYLTQDRYAETEPLFKRWLAALETVMGTEHPDVAAGLDILAGVYFVQEKYTEAEPLYRRSLAIQEKVLGPEHPEVATVLTNLGNVLYNQSQYENAKPFHERALKIREKTLGETHNDVATSLSQLAHVYYGLDQYVQAEPLYRRALQIGEANLGPDHLDVANALSNLAHTYYHQFNYVEAEPLYRRAVSIREKTLGADHADVATSINDLVNLYKNQGRYPEVQDFCQRHPTSTKTENPALPACVSLPSASDSVNLTVVNSGSFTLELRADRAQMNGQYKEAEELFKQAITILERALGPDHRRNGSNFCRIGQIYGDMSRSDEAEAAMKRGITLLETGAGPEDDLIRVSLQMCLIVLWQYHNLRGESEVADALKARYDTLNRQRKIKQISEVGPEAEQARELHETAERDLDLGNYTTVIALTDKAGALIAPMKARSGGLPPGVAGLDVAIQYTRATAYQKAGRLQEACAAWIALEEQGRTSAEKVGRRVNYASAVAYADHLFRCGSERNALTILDHAMRDQEETVGTTHITTAHVLAHRARARLALGDAGGARVDAGQALNILREWNVAEDAKGTHGRNQHSWTGRSLVALLQVLGEGTDGAADGFEVAQLTRTTDVSRAVAAMAARFAAGDGPLAGLVRQRQDAEDHWRQASAEVARLFALDRASRDPTQEKARQRDADEARKALQALDSRLAAEFPQYAELYNIQPLKVADAQALLGPDEALLAFAVADKQTFVFALRRDRLAMVPVNEEPEIIRSRVEAIRFAMDEDIPPFPAGEAHALYQTLLAPVADVLAGAKTVFLVPDGPLQGLPFALLLDAPPPTEMVDGPALKELPWLARRYGFVTLPAVSSLRALRRFAGNSVAPEPFLGIGDPLLGDHPVLTRGAKAGGQTRLARRALPSNDAARGFFGDVQALKSAPSLPDTADELAALARLLGAPADKALVLRERATEPVVRTELPLSNYQVVSFATHGLTSTDLPRFAEPALLLTPPEQASPENDGLLAASEIAKLKLNADWVILSACNTAAPDGTPGAEGLSGLAKAFFYAGTRALLVSHWPVVSETTVKLTGHMFAEAKAHPDIGRAEAHRRAMMALINDPNPQFAHPLFWAPFVVVGEGGTYRPE